MVWIGGSKSLVQGEIAVTAIIVRPAARRERSTCTHTQTRAHVYMCVQLYVVRQTLVVV